MSAVWKILSTSILVMMMNHKLMKLLLLSFVLHVALCFDQPNCHDDRSVIVHLFNWKHSDIALECERWLGPKGYCGVQVSPPSEHNVIEGAVPELHRPWWERYQPVSYLLETRSGSRAEFIDMVERCEAVNVRIYGDMIINHMTGKTESGIGSGGSSFNGSTLSFPDYGPDDFNCCQVQGTGNCVDGEVCLTETCDITDYQNAAEVRDCQLVGLVDLAIHLDHPKQTIRAYFEDLLTIGVAGFRIDACKHSWPDYLAGLINGLTLPDGTQPFIFNEVIDLGNEPIKGDEYFELGRVTEFRYCNHMFGAFRGYFPLDDLVDFGEDESWGMYPSEKAFVFVDNHDNQRGHGAGGEDILTFFEPKPYKLATAFAMAHPFGFVRIMSSYRWPGGRLENDAYGPPTNDGEDIKDVVINPDETCDDGSDHTWVCEHRWRQIANMAKWRNVAGGGAIENWWSNGNNQIAFSRNGAAFIAFNTEGTDMSESIPTSVPDGEYCDIIASNIEDCTSTVIVSNGEAQITIAGSADDPMVAFHTGSLIRHS